ncbi:MAG TPA: insulinase family protein [Vicinamibacterales bacterium]|nr:insulinase family protein [Vicinamibacterales bacterium]
MESSRLIFRRIAAAYAIVVCVLVAAPASAQSLSAKLPLNPAIHVGKLPNGITYYIRSNGEPAKRVSLRLAVKAGSIDEADDQRGLAHMLEHMAFNGSTHFKPGELIPYFESVGVAFGPHVNAYTSYDETVYMLNVPTDRAGALDHALQALSDFAGGMSLTDKEIDKERGVVLEEWRQRLGVASRLQGITDRAVYGQSKYAERLPIGLPESIQHFPYQRLRDFYRDNYTPDRIAIVVVGDLDAATAEQQIRQYFTPIPKRKSAKRPVYPVPAHNDTRVTVATDPEAQSSSLSVFHTRPLRKSQTVGDYRRDLVRSLFEAMLNARLAEIARRPDAPFLGASSGDDTLGRTVEAFGVSARVNEGGIPKGIDALEQELARVRQFGFGDAELERVKKGTLASYERAYNERDKSESPGLASELVALFLNDVPASGIATEYELAKRFVPTITTTETAALARELVTDTNRVVIVVAPEKKGVTPPSEAAVREALGSGAAATLTAWRDDAKGNQLLPTKPMPGRVTARREIREIGVTILTLSNGVTIWLKPTDFKNDQIIFTGWAKGGLANVSEAEYRNLSLMTNLVGTSGVGGFSPVDLGKMLSGQIANASLSMGPYTHGASGSATPKDIETSLQLLYLSFTAANHDPDAFELMKRRLRANLANQGQSPGAVFGERVRMLNTVNHYTARSMKVEDVDALDQAKMEAFYKSQYANAADFTFIVVGAFDVAKLEPLLATYIGSLPSQGSPTSTYSAVRLQFPTGVKKEVVNKGQEPKAQTVMSFFADTNLDELEMHRLRAATSILERHLRDQLREELGGTYSVGVDYTNTLPQPGYGTTTIQFGSAPDRADSLVATVMTELDRMRREGPSADDVQKVKETEKEGLETSFKQNGFWLGALQTAQMLGWDPVSIIHRTERTDTLTAENIHDAFRKYFPADRYTTATLLPEKGTH